LLTSVINKQRKMHSVAVGCIFDENNRRPPITCCSVTEHNGQCEHRPFWRNGDGTV